MTELERIRDQFQRSFDGESWLGPPHREILRSITHEQAAARPLGNAHSIWEILLHVTATHDLVLRRLRGEPVRALEPEEDWPPVSDAGEGAWHTCIADFEASAAALLEAITTLDPARLDEPVLEGFSSFYVTLHGLIQHDCYHFGQIGVLKKG